MKTVVVLSTLLLAMLSAGMFFHSTIMNEDIIPTSTIRSYSEWKKEFGKFYTSPSEDHYRLSVYNKMSEYLDRINREYESYTVHSGQKLSGKMFTVNMFSDLTDEEYYARYSNKMLLSETDYEVMNRESSGETNNLPIRPEKGLGQRPKYEIPVRNQGGCGSCWVFAALSAAEKLYFDKNGQYLDMSHQEIVDCAEKGYGCRGGFPMAAYEHILNQGISPASKYPYSGSQGKCQKKSGDAVRMKFSPMGGKPFTMKEVRRVLVEENKFVSIGLAATRAFSSLSNTPDYFDASATGDCKSGVNHVIAIVDIDSKEIVTILNSWGKGWGEKGFKRMKSCSSTNLYGDGAILSHP